MSESEKPEKKVFFEPIRAADVSPSVFLFYLCAIAVLALLWSGVLVINSSLLRFGALLLFAAVIFGVARSAFRFFRRRA